MPQRDRAIFRTFTASSYNKSNNSRIAHRIDRTFLVLLKLFHTSFLTPISHLTVTGSWTVNSSDDQPFHLRKLADITVPAQLTAVTAGL